MLRNTPEEYKRLKEAHDAEQEQRNIMGTINAMANVRQWVSSALPEAIIKGSSYEEFIIPCCDMIVSNMQQLVLELHAAGYIVTWYTCDSSFGNMLGITIYREHTWWTRIVYAARYIKRLFE